jgi:arsenite-transporting ATPase
MSIRVGAIVVNCVSSDGGAGVADALRGVADMAPNVPRLTVGRAARSPASLDEIEALFASESTARSRRAPRGVSERDVSAAIPHASVTELVRPLTIIAGKGGVGKTTVACALAVSVARRDGPVLVVSSDPAPSVADALGQPVPDEDVPVRDAPGCHARQMDATAAFARFRASYADRVDAMFDRLTGGAMDLAHDRAVARDLLALAPPGIDELYALVTLGELLADARYRSIIVDPAPTGHLLRLLEMPTLALSWTHRVMRLMLEYKEVAGLGDAAREMLDFARRTRSVRDLLTNPDQTSIVIVANDEPLVRDETRRLIAACRARGVHVAALVWNRVNETVAPLSGEEPPRQFAAPAVSPAPHGAPVLRAWCGSWLPLDEGIRG